MTSEDLFGKEFSPARLLEIYDQHISMTSAVGIDRLSRKIFKKSLEHEVDLIAKKALAGKYSFSQYKEKLISKGANKIPRVISIPTFRDRITLRASCNLLKSTFEQELEVKLPQHTISELREHLKSEKFPYFVKIDVKDFYPSIDHAILGSILASKNTDVRLSSIVRSAIETQTVAFPGGERSKEKKGVPQGLAISNVLAEIYLNEFDKWARALSGTRYFRYVDDILVLTEAEPEAMFKAFQHRLRDTFKLIVHDLGHNGKSVVGQVSDAFHFLGYEFKNSKAYVKLDSIRRLESSIAKIFTTYKYRYAAAELGSGHAKKNGELARIRKIFLWRLNLRITGCVFDGTRRGWVFYFSGIDEEALDQLYQLDETVRVLAQRFSVKLDPTELRLFARTFHESHRNNSKHRYIPNFDTTSLDRQREILELYGLENVDKMADSVVAHEFKKRIRRETQELQLDVQGTS